ncbi:hypothetical protein GGX14DRAFT_576449 [Mycena pura]|uniref:Uncharacterized protein n=1 Tax=Mycena pura TaxID=153505 RepID=A0AAD6UXQ6_9AGAR|nr:hypothetical protein GGX14DRAFT_576449 [Mycena pura]
MPAIRNLAISTTFDINAPKLRLSLDWVLQTGVSASRSFEVGCLLASSLFPAMTLPSLFKWSFLWLHLYPSMLSLVRTSFSIVEKLYPVLPSTYLLAISIFALQFLLVLLMSWRRPTVAAVLPGFPGLRSDAPVRALQARARGKQAARAPSAPRKGHDARQAHPSHGPTPARPCTAAEPEAVLEQGNSPVPVPGWPVQKRHPSFRAEPFIDMTPADPTPTAPPSPHDKSMPSPPHMHSVQQLVCTTPAVRSNSTAFMTLGVPVPTTHEERHGCSHGGPCVTTVHRIPQLHMRRRKRNWRKGRGWCSAGRTAGRCTAKHSEPIIRLSIREFCPYYQIIPVVFASYLL